MTLALAFLSYTYGSGQGTPSSITDNGQVLSVTDGLSGIADNITYDHTVADGGFGQPSQTSESWPWDTGGSQHGYSVSYAGHSQNSHRQEGRYGPSTSHHSLLS